MEEYVLGYDIGTTGTKVLLVDLCGTILGSAYQGYPTQRPSALAAEQDLESVWQAGKTCIQRLTARFPAESKRIRAIGFSGQMHGLAAVDKAGAPVGNLILWADRRSQEVIESACQKIGKETICEETGNAWSTGFLTPSLLWLQTQDPARYARIANVMLPKDYIRYRMTGEIATDRSDASASGAFQMAKGTWAIRLLDALGLDASLFPAIHSSLEIAAPIRKACAEELGLPADVRLIYGGGDSMMQAIGNGMAKPGSLSCNLGTAGQVAVVVPTPVHDPRFRTNTFCHVEDGLWLLQGSSLNGGVALKWLKDALLHLDSYETLDREAACAPAGSDGLLFLPYLNGERCPVQDPNACGLYWGLRLHHTRAHLIRSTMEGILFGLYQSALLFQEMGISWEKVIASGGGARSPLLRQIQADLFNQPVYVCKEQEQAGFGAALCAMVGIHAYPDLAAACQALVRWETPQTVPIAENVAVYRERLKAFAALYPHNQTLFKD